MERRWTLLRLDTRAAGECLELATEQIVSPGGATNSPINNGLKQVVFDYDQSKESFCPDEQVGDEITITGQVIVRRVDDAGEVTCELCPEAECYMWIPNLGGRYVPECSGKCVPAIVCPACRFCPTSLQCVVTLPVPEPVAQ